VYILNVFLLNGLSSRAVVSQSLVEKRPRGATWRKDGTDESTDKSTETAEDREQGRVLILILSL
jgi:hypothetical protein